jgi:hypothetical protein
VCAGGGRNANPDGISAYADDGRNPYSDQLASLGETGAICDVKRVWKQKNLVMRDEVREPGLVTP